MNDNSFILTYIIPFYNGGKYIHACLDSIFAIGLTEDQLEVLVIDDCSPEAASDVLRTCVLKHPNLRIVRHLNNTRQGGAKNTGIREAKGKYVAFADQDDVVLSANVKEAVKMLNGDKDLDVLSCRWEIQQLGEEPVELGINPPLEYSVDGVSFCEAFVDPRVSFGPWSYFYRRAYLCSQCHPMAENVLMEDADWITWHLFHAEKVAFFGKPIYRWNYREDSTSHIQQYQTKVAWIALGLRIIECCEEYRKRSVSFADKMFDNGLYDIELQFRTLWEINDYKAFYATLQTEGYCERLLKLPISQRTKHKMKHFRLFSVWYMIYRPVRMLGHKLKSMFMK